MSNVNSKQFVGLILASSVMVLTVACSKQAPQEAVNPAKNTTTSSAAPAPKAYQEGVEAYQAGNFTLAAEKFRTLAEQGDASAQFNLGSLYRQGEGVAQDDKQAALWWAKAADQGHTDAMDNLGLRFAKGEGVELDLVQAYKWFSIAGMRKNESAAANAKVTLAKMTPAQIEEAQNIAKEWMVQHPKQ
ncbi:MAG: sel1 repeat family protein [Gallionella sp.]|nr:sel1 repeat family protein [Gallionella sp.]